MISKATLKSEKAKRKDSCSRHPKYNPDKAPKNHCFHCLSIFEDKISKTSPSISYLIKSRRSKITSEN